MLNPIPLAVPATPHVVRRVAVEAQVAPSTVSAALAGEPGKASIRQRIFEALARLDLLDAKDARALLGRAPAVADMGPVV